MTYTVNQISRKKSIESYYENPNICLNCGKVIEVGYKQVASTRKKKFCNSSCSAIYNNKKYPKRISSNKESKCLRCGCVIRLEKSKNGGYLARKYCDMCLPEIRVEIAKTGNHSPNGFSDEKTTKGDILAKYGKTETFRARITSGSRKNYSNSGRPYMCFLCKYGEHVQICHIRPVSDFPDSATLAEINNLDNLIALCPNHHWELDHGILEDSLRILTYGKDWWKYHEGE